MLSVYFYVFTCGWYVCVGAPDEQYRVVFIDGRHGARRHFLCLLIINQPVSSSSARFFFFFHFCLFLWISPFLISFSSHLFSSSPLACFFLSFLFFLFSLVLCLFSSLILLTSLPSRPSFTLFLLFSSLYSPSVQSADHVWTTPPSSPLDPPCSQVAVKVLAAVASVAAASSVEAWDTTAATRPSPTPSTTSPSCRHPMRQPWNLSSTATAPWRGWVSWGGDEGMKTEEREWEELEERWRKMGLIDYSGPLRAFRWCNTSASSHTGSVSCVQSSNFVHHWTKLSWNKSSSINHLTF